MLWQSQRFFNIVNFSTAKQLSCALKQLESRKIFFVLDGICVFWVFSSHCVVWHAV
jgi:hypothetical protein